MKSIAIAARILLGAMFIFSGFVKGIDPLGSTYKFIDYFTAFDMLWLHDAAFVLAVLQNIVEVVIGVALVIGLRMNETAWGTLLFMGFYTILTFILALTNPVSDCGCFGDALILTNWETFYKNLGFMVPTVIVFLYRKKYVPPFGTAGEWSLIVFASFVMFQISMHCYNHLPWIDFRPYRIGADIPQGMIIPEDAPIDEYHTTLFYEKDGEVKEFTMNDYPWNDSTWVFRDIKNVLVKQGYVPPIRDFSIISSEGYDMTDEVLADEGYTFLLVAHNLNKSDASGLKKAMDIANFSQIHGYNFLCLTATLMSDVEKIKSDLELNYEFYNTDEITLKTIIRANPGLVLLHNGTVIGKWHHNDIPNVELLKPNLLSFSIETQTTKSKNRLIYSLLLAFTIFALATYYFRIND